MGPQNALSVDTHKFERISRMQISFFLLSTLSLIVALAWNDAVLYLFTEPGPHTKKYRVNPWVYALGVTLFSVIVISIYLIVFVKKPMQLLSMETMAE